MYKVKIQGYGFLKSFDFEELLIFITIHPTQKFTFYFENTRITANAFFKRALEDGVKYDLYLECYRIINGKSNLVKWKRTKDAEKEKTDNLLNNT
jgi:hypothetical protein